MAYIERTSKYIPADMVYYNSVTDSNKWWYDYSLNTGATAQLCLPNCTTYALGRSSEIAGFGIEQAGEIFTNTGFPDAGYWYPGNSNHPAGSWVRQSTPELGAIACWSTGTRVSDGSYIGGHVAIVERIDDPSDPNQIWVSFSGYVAASSGTRSFTNPGDSVAGYFRYMTLAQAKSWYEQIYFTCSWQGYIINPYAGTTPTPTPLTEELIAAIGYILKRKRKGESL